LLATSTQSRDLSRLVTIVASVVIIGTLYFARVM